MDETAWDYLFFSFKANLPLTGTYRTDLDKLQKAINTIVEIELESKKRIGAKEELEEILSYCNKETRRIESVGVDFVRIDDLTKYVEKRLKSLEEGRGE